MDGPPKHRKMYKMNNMYKLPVLGIYYKLVLLVKKWAEVIVGKNCSISRMSHLALVHLHINRHSSGVESGSCSSPYQQKAYLNLRG